MATVDSNQNQGQFMVKIVVIFLSLWLKKVNSTGCFCMCDLVLENFTCKGERVFQYKIKV